MRSKKSSSGDTSPVHPYIAEYISHGVTLTEKAKLRAGWMSWSNVVKDRDGRVISFKIVTKNL